MTTHPFLSDLVGNWKTTDQWLKHRKHVPRNHHNAALLTIIISGPHIRGPKTGKSTFGVSELVRHKLVSAVTAKGLKFRIYERDFTFCVVIANALISSAVTAQQTSTLAGLLSHTGHK